MNDATPPNNQVPFFIPGPTPPGKSTDPNTGTNVGAESAPGAPNLHAKSAAETLFDPQSTASSIPLTTMQPSLSSKPAQTSAKSAVSSKYVDMSQLKAELEDVREMVSDVVTRLINILERLQNLHAGNPATMAQIKRLKAATEKLLASADDVSNEVAGIEHEHKTPTSGRTHSGVSAPTQNTVGSSPVTQSGTGNLAQAPTTSALPAKPTQPTNQEKIDRMKRGVFTAFSKLASMNHKLKDSQTDDKQLLEQARKLSVEFQNAMQMMGTFSGEIDQLSANKNEQQIFDFEIKLTLLSSYVSGLEQRFTELMHQINFFDDFEKKTAEKSNGISSNNQAVSNTSGSPLKATLSLGPQSGGSAPSDNKDQVINKTMAASTNLKGGQAPDKSSADKSIETSKSTAISGKPASSAQSSRSAYQTRIMNLYEGFRATDKYATAIWYKYFEKINNDQLNDERTLKLRSAYKALQDNLTQLSEILEKSRTDFWAMWDEKLTHELPNHHSSLGGILNKLPIYENMHQQMIEATRNLEQECISFLEGNAVKNDGAGKKPTPMKDEIKEKDTKPPKT
ncbi:hypothetical protein [Noviherbaspirillum pedocola]|uniref:Uncharacterized protein n=1 Tax=Noviherbaspirillum pedocola TaxID=2801341 RepID=A0A934W6W6_9BURK|nr:hypothetical protein [Noviherbaspirillum pedocola]MBK4735640.1 hypothetical protein [Noviherbaspirillum pedocola]